jgi:tripartite-type tricarboxylate transporter receptor subunit TctC
LQSFSDRCLPTRLGPRALDAGSKLRNNARKREWQRGSCPRKPKRTPNRGLGRDGNEKMSLTRRTFLYGTAASGIVSSSFAQSPAWPMRPLRIIIPTAPGGSPDMVSRTLGNKLTERLGQPVIVESVTHGIGIQGNNMVSRSAPDGHTLAMLTGGFTTQAAVVKTLPYHPVRDFAFVTTVVAYPMFILVAPSSPIASFKDLIDRAKANPGKISYGIIGGGSVYHLLGKWIENRADLNMVAVPYRGSVPAFTDVIGGRLDAMLDTGTSAIPRIRSGQLRPLAVSSPERYPLVPDTPTMAESIPGIQLMSWLGIAAAPQTPRPIIDRLNSELRRALEQPDVKKWLTETGVLAAPSTPEEFQKRIETEIELYTKIAEANGIKAE